MEAYLIALLIFAVCITLSMLVWRSRRSPAGNRDMLSGGRGRFLIGALLVVMVYLVAASFALTAKQLFVVSGSALVLIGSWIIAGFIGEKWR